MDLHFSEEQEVLRASARAFFERECSGRRLRAWLDRPETFDDDFAKVWAQLAELGWTGLALPAEHGGAGLGWLELAIVLEEAGRALLPGPFLSAALGATAVALAGSEPQRARLVPGLADGSRRATLAWLEAGASWDPGALRLTARPRGDGFALTGAKRFAMDAHVADGLVVPARLGAEPALFWVDARAEGVAIRPIACVDPTLRPCEVRLDAAPAERLGAAGAPLLHHLLHRARAATCAELCGLAAAALERAVAFAKSREQFGQAIGSFQAIQHRCADMLVRVEAARSATWDAAGSLAAGADDAGAAADMAKAWCSEACVAVAGDAIQIHGGLGFTWEQDLHLYYKRAKWHALAWGDASFCRERVARAVLDG